MRKRVFHYESLRFQRDMLRAFSGGMEKGELRFALVRIKIGVDSEDGGTPSGFTDSGNPVYSMRVQGRWEIRYAEEHPGDRAKALAFERLPCFYPSGQKHLLFLNETRCKLELNIQYPTRNIQPKKGNTVSKRILLGYWTFLVGYWIFSSAFLLAILSKSNLSKVSAFALTPATI